MFAAIQRRSNNRENCLILMLRQNATQEAFLAIRNNARQLWWLHYQTPSTFHQVLTTQISGAGQSGKWDGSRDPDRQKNVRRDYYNFVYFTPDEMHLNTSLWYLLFLQDTIIKIFKKFLRIIRNNFETKDLVFNSCVLKVWYFSSCPEIRVWVPELLYSSKIDKLIFTFYEI